MLIAVLALFALAAAAPLLQRRLPESWTPLVLAALPAGLAVYFGMRSIPSAEGWEWAPLLGLRLSFLYDGLARLLALLITGIGSLVLIYAGPYMHGHPRLGRFYLYLLLFMGSMLGLVLADNLLLLFVFWELTSFSSYLLIGFEQDRAEARASALQALLVTAGGGLALLAGVVLLGIAGGSFEMSELARGGDTVRAHTLYVPALVLILVGAFTKSAQAPFHFWLPDAMSAPTPVSAYLHSSTMVKAGVYLIARLTPVLGATAVWQGTVTAVGAATMIVGAVLACAQTDLKRLLAYATVSALGVMTMLLGIGGEEAFAAAVMFLLAHAFYKGALFLVAGGVVHATGEREITQLGGLRRAMPFTALAGILAALSMSGLPPLGGFLAKELALDSVWHAQAFAAGLLAATAFSSALLVAVGLAVGLHPFVGHALTPQAAGAEEGDAPGHPHEGPPGLWLGALLLACLGALSGLAPWLVQPVVAAAAGSIAGHPVPLKLALWHGINVPLLVGTAALAAGVAGYRFLPVLRAGLSPFDRFPAGPAEIYRRAFAGLFRIAGLQTRVVQSGYLRHYILIVVGVTVALLVGTLAIRRVPLETGATEVRFFDVALAAAIVLAAGGTIVAKTNLGAVAALGAIGFAVALFFAIFGAPDLAMTQLVVEALLVILFVLVLYDTPKSDPRSSDAARTRDWVLAGGAGVLMTILVLVATAVPHDPPVSSYFVDQSVPAAHGHNVVNVILVDFRALDTLGEITVIALAGIGVHALVRLRPGRPQS